MFSQRDEELHILRALDSGILPSEGTFLDVGAYDGKTFSNTFALANRGWWGVLVEPSPLAFEKLSECYRKHGLEENFVLVPAALVSEAREGATLTLFESNGDAVSTISEAQSEVWKEHTQYRKVEVPWITWPDLLGVAGGGFHFLSLDADGINTELLLASPPELWESLRMVCVEKDNGTDGQRSSREAIMRFMEGKRGWSLTHETAENLLFVRA